MKPAQGFAPILVLISVLVAITLGFGGALIYKNYSGNNNGLEKDEVPITTNELTEVLPSPNPSFSALSSNIPTNPPSTKPLPTAYPNNISTTGWKTYTKPKHYSFKYPPEWVILKEDEYFFDIELSDPAYVYKTENNHSGYGVKLSFNVYQLVANTKAAIDYLETKSTVVDGTPGRTAYDPRNNSYSTIIPKNDVQYAIDLFADEKAVLEKYTPVYGQILSTFKFTE